jgi:hypothetical protein
VRGSQTFCNVVDICETRPFSHHQHLTCGIQNLVLAYVWPKSRIVCSRPAQAGSGALTKAENFAILKYTAAPSDESESIDEGIHQHGGYHHY